MGWLNMRKPLGFRHTFLYVDERNAQVRQTRRRVSEKQAPADGGMFDVSRRLRQTKDINMQMMAGIFVPMLMLALVLAGCLLLF